MLRLSDRVWKSLYIGELFLVKRPETRSEKNYAIGDVPFIASGNTNNGVIKCCTPQKHEILDRKNCISVSPVDGSAFYHEYNFLGRGGAGSSVLLLYNDRLNRYSGLFMTRMIRQTCAKYCYGKMGNKDGIKREKIMLPVDKNGSPDYAFMEAYMKEREEYLIRKYERFIFEREKTIGGGGGGKSPIFWKSFFLTEIFPKIKRGKRLKRADHISGTMPYVSSSSVINGIDAFISNNNGVRIYVNCLTIANSGSVGSCHYHPYRFVASDHVTSLHNPHLNLYHYIFLAAILSRLSEKYNFNREINDSRISREKVLLPSTNTGLPDYAYMEEYGRQVMTEKYRQYFNYLKSKQ